MRENDINVFKVQTQKELDKRDLVIEDLKKSQQ